MEYTSHQIKYALQQVALDKGRDSYAMIVIREVLEDFRNNRNSPLKELVLKKLTSSSTTANIETKKTIKDEKNIELPSDKYNGKIELTRLQEYCDTDEKVIELSKRSGYSTTHLKKIINGKAKLTRLIWLELEISLAFLEKENQYKENLEKAINGYKEKYTVEN